MDTSTCAFEIPILRERGYMKNLATTTIAMSIFLLECGWPSTAMAVDLGEDVELHGYGHVGFLATDVNRYLKADSGGTEDYRDMALLFTAKLNERSKAWAQFYSIYGKARVDWAFVDYQVANGPTLRLGQIKLPVGLYNETRDVEFIRPSSLKPFLYHDAAQIADESYRGLGLAYDHDLGGGNLSWDAYAGRVVEFESGEQRHKGLVGGRVTYQTPVDGLSAMFSVYSTRMEVAETGETGRKKASIWSLDYTRDALDLKAEYGRKTALGETGETWYGQAAYTLRERWTPYFRYDYITTDRANRDDPSFCQRAKVVGLGYRFNDHLGLRLETHFNHGYAMPVAAGEMDAGTGKTDWRMTAVSLNFIF